MTTTPAAPSIENLGQVRSVVAAARSRMQIQEALEGATTASIVASAAALATVFGVRTEALEPGVGIGMLAACGGVIVAGAVMGALRRLDDEEVARRIDRASGLADRLSTAIAFDRVLSQPPGTSPRVEPGDDETVEMMRAAMRDAARAAPRADVQAATPFRRPTDLPIALGFAAVAAIAAGIGVPLPDDDPKLLMAVPGAARRGAEITVTGERLCGADATPDAVCHLDGAAVYLGKSDGIATSVVAWTGEAITLTVPMTARPGKTKLAVYAGGDSWGAVDFEVLADDDPRNFTDDTVVLRPDDEAYMRELAADLRATGEKDQVPELGEYAAKIEEQLDKAAQGELTKEELLAEMKKAESALLDSAEPDQKQIDQDLKETGEELAKNDLTKELGKALAENDLEKAQKELEKLAEKLDKNELTPEQQEKLAQAMEQAAQQYQKKQDERTQKNQDQVQKAEDQVRKLEKERDEAKNEQEREDAERRLEKKKRELSELKKKQEEREQSAQRRSLKRLHKDMEKAAQQLKKDQKQQDGEQKPQDGEQDGDQKGGEQKQQDGEQDGEQNGQKQASRTLKDIADETGKVDSDQRKQAAQKKVSSQMEDLREAMRRAKQRGSKGPNNPFGQNQKGKHPGMGQDGRGQQAGKGKGQQPGQGQEGQGKGQQPGGQQPGQTGPSNTYGDEHDPNLVGEQTDKSGDTADESISGVHGKKGPSRRETILSAAQKGFASTAYRNVYADYKKVVEDVMRTEKVPSSYRYYVKKYFTKIKPHSMD